MNGSHFYNLRVLCGCVLRLLAGITCLLCVYVFCAWSVFGHRRAGSHGNPFINTGNQGNLVSHHTSGETFIVKVIFVARDARLRLSLTLILTV